MNSSESKVESKLVLAKNLNFNDKKLELIELFVQEVLSYNQKYNLISRNSEKTFGIDMFWIPPSLLNI